MPQRLRLMDLGAELGQDQTILFWTSSQKPCPSYYHTVTCQLADGLREVVRCSGKGIVKSGEASFRRFSGQRMRSGSPCSDVALVSCGVMRAAAPPSDWQVDQVKIL